MVFVILFSAARAEDWPRWRGPRGDGSWKGPALADAFPAAGLRTVWKKPVGAGYAGLSVVGDRLYTMDRLKEPTERERVVCLGAATGETVWTHDYPVEYGKLDYGNGPRAAPTVHEGRVYALGAVGHLHCLDAATGKPIWSHDLVRVFGSQVPTWGFAASPLIEGRLVIVHTAAKPGGCLVAFDRLDGKEVWRSLDDPAGYCTPLAIDAPSGRQLAVWTPKNIHGVDPKDGKRLWSFPYDVTYGVSIAGLLYRENILFVSGYWHGSKAIQLGEKPTDATMLWEDNRNLRGLMAQPLYRDGLVYSLDKQFGLTAFELKSGKKIWDDGNRMTPKGRNPQASFVQLGDGDRVLCVNSTGELILARFTPQGYVELARAKAVEGKVWGHPAFADRFVFVRRDGAERPTPDGEIVCVELPLRQ